MSWDIWEGECVETMRLGAEGGVDAVVTDPPYGLGFMGHEWDQPGLEVPEKREGIPSGQRRRSQPEPKGFSGEGGAKEAGRYDLSRTANQAFQSWCRAWAEECFRALKPGGYLLSFGGTRTYHRLACAVEDAGFEIRDSLIWLYGSGFPKSHNVQKALDKKGEDGSEWEGWGTALKPAHEPIVVARKPLEGTVVKNVLEHGTGALNIGACRIGLDGAEQHTTPAKSGLGKHGIYSASTVEEVPTNDELPRYNLEGRWPANVALSPEAAAELDEQSGGRGQRGALTGDEPSSKTDGIFGKFDHRPATPARGDTGGASRFFYCAKAAKGERGAGLDARNTHPTVKPIELMRWLVRLVTPPGGKVLDPFTGSGTTGIAAVLEGFDFVGIEREAEYAALARARIDWWEGRTGSAKEILKAAAKVGA